MCWMALIPAAVSLVGGAMGAQNEQRNGAFQSALLIKNAQIKDNAAHDAEQRGAIEADQHRLKTRDLIGSQRTGFAANGIDVNSGSAATLQDDAAQYGELDALTIANNAAREAYGYRVGAYNDRMNAAAIKTNSKNNAMGSILGGVGGAFSAFGGR